MRTLPCWLALLAFSCQEHTFTGPEAEPDKPAGDTQDTEREPLLDNEPPEDTQDTAPPVVEEECNGEDDDGDGLVDGVETLIDTHTIGALPIGQSMAGEVFEIHPAEWGEDGILIRVDDVGTGYGTAWECDESNNEYEYREAICGG